MNQMALNEIVEVHLHKYPNIKSSIASRRRPSTTEKYDKYGHMPLPTSFIVVEMSRSVTNCLGSGQYHITCDRIKRL